MSDLRELSHAKGMFRRRSRGASGLLFFILACALLLCVARSVVAQAEITWQPPTLLHETEGDILQPSHILVDQTGRVHIFWSESEVRPEDGEPLYYLWYSSGLDGVWTSPLDVLAAGGSGSALRGKAIVDPAGNLHAIWSTAAALEYSVASAADAAAANAWTRPAPISGQRVVEGALALAPDGRLWVTYADWDGGVYLQSLDLREHRWSAPALVYSAVTPEASPESSLILIDDTGALHLFWTEVPLSGGHPPLASFHTVSRDGGESWSLPEQLSGEGFRLQSGVAVGEELHVLLLGTASVRERRHRWSADGGRSWSLPQQIVDSEQGAGLSQGSIAADSAGDIYAVFGMQSDAAIGYAHWDGAAWSAPQSVPGAGGVAVEDVRMAVGDGNRLHIVYVDRHRELYYATGQTGAPARTRTPFSPADVPADDSPEPALPTPLPVDEPTQVPVFPTTPARQPAYLTYAPLVLSLAGGALIVIPAVVFYRRKRRRR